MRTLLFLQKRKGSVKKGVSHCLRNAADNREMESFPIAVHCGNPPKNPSILCFALHFEQGYTMRQNTCITLMALIT